MALPKPETMPMRDLRTLISDLMEQRKFARALNALDQALARQPDDVSLGLRRGIVLRNLGRRPEALAALRALHDRAPTNRGVLCELATSLRRAGENEPALRVLNPLLEQDPTHQRARLEQVAALLGHDEYAAALHAADTGLRHTPDLVDMQMLRAKALRGVGDVVQAAQVFKTLHDKRPGNPEIGIALAETYRTLGEMDAADDVLARLTKSAPNHIPAWTARIDLALERGRTSAADALCATALSRHSDSRALILRQCSVLQAMQRPQSAIDLVAAALARKPSDPLLRSRLVQIYYQTGEPDAARDIAAAAPDGTVESQANLLKRAEVAQTRGDVAAALGIIAADLDLDGGADLPLPIATGVRYCELAVQADKITTVPPILDRLALSLGEMSDSNLMRMFKLGERVEHLGVSVRVIEEIAQRKRIKPVLAQFLVQRAQMVMDPTQVAVLARKLQDRLTPREQPEFSVFATSLTAGPDAALDLARANIKPPATLAQAVTLAEQILAAGHFRLAMRYLRHCVRRWPNDTLVRRLFLRSCSDVGDLAQGHAWLDALEASNPQIDIDVHRVDLLVLGARLKEALELVEARKARGLKTRASVQVMELYLSLGRYEDAVAMGQVVRGSPSVGKQTSGHFGATLLGSRLKELGLYRDDAEHLRATGLAQDAIDRQLATRFVYPAKRIIDDWLDAHGAGVRDVDETNIPPRVLQYWNTPLPPAEVAGVMQSWDADGVDHQVFDRISALAFLRKNFGEKHVRAFVLANSVAEECDFLRLCLLYKFGGTYADADDRLVGNLDELRGHGNGMIVVREMMGTIANNVICARAGHPLLKIAIALAGQSLLRRENDSTWSKTGPGLLTRAVAVYLHDTDVVECQRDLTILPADTLQRYVQQHVRLSYKSKSTYWNAKDGRVPDQIVAALQRLGGSDPDAA